MNVSASRSAQVEAARVPIHPFPKVLSRAPRTNRLVDESKTFSVAGSHRTGGDRASAKGPLVNDSYQDKHDEGGVIDMRVIAELRELGGDEDPGLLAELIDLFLRDAPERLQEVQTGLATGEIKLVERAAHTLKSSSANIGAKRLSVICRRIEELARNLEKDAIAPLLADTSRSFAETESALRALKT